MTQAVKAKSAKRRLKMLLFGESGSFKTPLAIQFPSPVILDTEDGTDYYGDDADFNVVKTRSVDAIMEEVHWYLTNEHDRRTLVLDSITEYWKMLQEKYADIFLQRQKKSPGYKFEYYVFQPSDYRVFKAELYKLIRKLRMSDMNIIVTAHQKKEYADGEFMKVIGDTFDCDKDTDYMFDTVIQTFSKKDKYMGRCLRDRTKNFKKNEEFELSYSAFENLFKDALTKKATPVKFATPEQIDEIDNYRVMLQIPEDKFKKSLANYEAETIEELKKDNAEIILKKLENAYNKQKGESNG